MIDSKRRLLLTTGLAASAIGIAGEAKAEDGDDVDSLFGRHKSGIAGSTVWLTPSSPGPFRDADEAIRSVPEGGTLVLLDDYEIRENLGRPNLEFHHPVTIQGVGWAEITGGPTLRGPVIRQNSSAYGKPSIHFNNDDGYGNPKTGISRGGKIFNIGVWHRGDETAAIKIDHMSHCMLRDIFLHGQRSGRYGVHVQGHSSMAFRMYNARIKRFHECGVLEEGATGGNHVLNDCHIEAGSVSAVKTTTNDWTIRDGEYSSSEDGGTLILMDDTLGNAGAFIIDNPRLEVHSHNSTGIRIRSSAGKTHRPGIIRNPLCFASMYNGTVFMDVDDIENLVIENPIGSKWTNDGTILVRFGVNARNCTLLAFGMSPNGLVQDDGVGNRVIDGLSTGNTEEGSGGKGSSSKK